MAGAHAKVIKRPPNVIETPPELEMKGKVDGPNEKLVAVMMNVDGGARKLPEFAIRLVCAIFYIDFLLIFSTFVDLSLVFLWFQR